MHEERHTACCRQSPVSSPLGSDRRFPSQSRTAWRPAMAARWARLDDMIDATVEGAAHRIDGDAACKDDAVASASNDRPALRSVALVYEDRKAWATRARARHFSRQA